MAEAYLQRNTHKSPVRAIVGMVESNSRFRLWLAVMFQLLATVLVFARIAPLYFFYRFLQDCFNSRDLASTSSTPPSFGYGVIWIGIIWSLDIATIFFQAHGEYQMEVLAAEWKTIFAALMFNKSFHIDPGAPVKPLKASKQHDHFAPFRRKHASPSSSDITNQPESTGQREQWSTGLVLNVINSDTLLIEFGICQFARLLATAPSLLISAGIFIWLLGKYSPVVIALLLLMMVIAYVTGWRALKLRERANEYSDKRVHILSDTLKSIRFVKMFGWEHIFQAQLNRIRWSESKEIQRVNSWTSLSAAFNIMGITVPPVAAYALFSINNDTYQSTTIVFTSITFLILDNVQWPIVSAFTDCVIAVASLRRVGSYIQAQPPPVSPIKYSTSSEFALSTKDLKLSWSSLEAGLATDQAPQKTSFALAPVNLDFRCGELIAVVGATRSGKSSLLSGLVGEMRCLSGEAEIQGLPAYSPQETYIQSGSVKKNILFGQEFREVTYRQVLRACALEQDLQQFPAGDATELGEFGINLSGGQKARMQLARTLYLALVGERNVVLLDDPLAAVDSTTVHTLFQEAIKTLLSKKCCVLVTHQLHLLSQCDRVVWLSEGEIKAVGTYEQLQSQTPGFAEFVRHHQQSDERRETRFDKVAKPLLGDGDGKESLSDALLDEEERADYTVPWSLYFKYLGNNRSKLIFLLILGVLLISEASFILTSLQAAWWASDKFQVSDTANALIYLAIVMVHTLTHGPYLFLVKRFFISRSLALSQSALQGVLNAPVAFFDVNPVGRIINRFTADMNLLDNQAPGTIHVLTLLLMFLIATLGSVASYIPLILTFLAPWSIFSIIIIQYFKSTPLEIKRISINKASSYMSLLHEGFNHHRVIACAEQQAPYADELHRRLDTHNGMQFMAYSSARWLHIIQSLSFSALTFGGGLLIIRLRFDVQPSIAIIVMNLLPAASSILQTILLQISQVQISVNAAERLENYGSSLPVEGAAHTARLLSIENWPTQGSILFENVCFRYRPNLPLCLTDVSLNIMAGQKVGIVGRTGAGKSSLLAALLRINELDGGEIIVDGVNLKDVGIHDLRHNIAIIPQDPTLFAGTIRFNLDPASECDDDMLMKVLAQVGLSQRDCQHQDNEKNFIRDLSLDDNVDVNGDNFSAGEKQLLSLARALVRKSRIILMDEATSNVDSNMDAIVQRFLISSSNRSTVLSIAHRIRTILNYDQVVVVDAGRIVETGPPRELFSRQDSIFHALCTNADIQEQDIVDTGR